MEKRHLRLHVAEELPCSNSGELRVHAQDLVKHLFREPLGRWRPPGPQPRCGVLLRLTKGKMDGAVAQEHTGTRDQLPPDTNNTWEQQHFRQHQLDSSGRVCLHSLRAKPWCRLPWVGKCRCFQEFAQLALKSVLSLNSAGFTPWLMGFYSPLSQTRATDECIFCCCGRFNGASWNTPRVINVVCTSQSVIVVRIGCGAKRTGWNIYQSAESGAKGSQILQMFPQTSHLNLCFSSQLTSEQGNITWSPKSTLRTNELIFRKCFGIQLCTKHH